MHARFERSTPAQKLDYLMARVQRIREAQDLEALCFKLAKEMQDAHFYSKTTYLQDIAMGLKKKILRLGLRQPQQRNTKGTP